MLIPTIHSNGDSQKNLLTEATDALRDLRKSRETILKITVNGRNFYPQGPGVINEATNRFREMVSRFDSVITEIEEYAMAVSDGGFK